MRAKMNGEIERDGGGLEVYTTNVNIAQGRQEYAEFAHGNEEPSNDSMTFLFNGNRFTTLVYFPLHSANSLYKFMNIILANISGGSR